MGRTIGLPRPWRSSYWHYCFVLLIYDVMLARNLGGYSSLIFLRTRFVMLKSLQVKTLSFLTYLLRGFTPLMQPYEKQISSSVINLLKNCPADAVATRKELLVATRHILATEFRKGFFSEVCRLLAQESRRGW